MKRLLTLIFVSVASMAAAQDGWKRGGLAGATVSQTSLSNWSAGGEGSAAYNLTLNYEADLKRGKTIWDNRLELAYGMMWSKSKGRQKNNDRIYLSSMYGYDIGRKWYFSALGTFQTQFADGFDYGASPRRKISRFMAPGYLGAGLGFTWKPREWFTATLSPIAWRGTWVTDDALFWDAKGNPVDAFGVKHGRHFRNEIGANARLELNRDIAKNLHLYSRLDLFSNCLHKPQNVDVRWDVALTSALTKWLSAGLTLNMLYDDDIRTPRRALQVREILGVGLQTKF